MIVQESDLRYEAEVITGLRSAMHDLGNFNWEEALDPQTQTFLDLEFALTNLDDVDYGKARNWYYDTFEDNNMLFEQWIELWFGPLWAKVAREISWN